MGLNDFLSNYTPEKVTDRPKPFKGFYKCNVNHCRIEDYEGEKEAYIGHKFCRYELEVCAGQENAGRKLWKSYDLGNEASVQKLADAFFTLGLEFKNEEELDKCREQFADMTLDVKAWFFTPKDAKEGDDPVQMHIMKAVSAEKGETKKSEVPF